MESILKERQVKHLRLRSLEFRQRPESKGESILILGNAYGVMPYQLPLASALADRGMEPWWFSFSGQPGTEGSFSTDSVLQDVSVALKYLATERAGQPISIIAHCMGGLIALEYLRTHQEDIEQIRKMIIYGLLFDPARRWRHALPKLKKSGVNVGFTKAETNYSPLPALGAMDIPLLFCHAKDKLNLRRANADELALAVKTSPQAELVWFDRGYDRDLETLPDFVECYYSWLKQPESAPSEDKTYAGMDD
jgi:alpha-beta hydrolase superfamily lysophospholipase